MSKPPSFGFFIECGYYVGIMGTMGLPTMHHKNPAARYLKSAIKSKTSVHTNRIQTQGSYNRGTIK